MSCVLPGDVDERPVSVIGGGTFGRRIATMFSAGGSRVHLFSRSAGTREAARRFAGEHASDVRERPGLAAGSPTPDDPTGHTTAPFVQLRAGSCGARWE